MKQPVLQPAWPRQQTRRSTMEWRQNWDWMVGRDWPSSFQLDKTVSSLNSFGLVCLIKRSLHQAPSERASKRGLIRVGRCWLQRPNRGLCIMRWSQARECPAEGAVIWRLDSRASAGPCGCNPQEYYDEKVTKCICRLQPLDAADRTPTGGAASTQR